MAENPADLTKPPSTIEQRNFRSLSPQILAAIVSMSSHIAVGISMVYSAILIAQLEDATGDIRVTENETSWIASVFALVAPIGCIASSYSMDKWGRITALKLSLAPSVIGWALLANASSVAMIISGRIVTGFAYVVSTSPAIVYVTEISREDVRGSLVSLGTAFVSLGMLVAYLKGWLMHWKTIAWSCEIYVIVPFVLLFVIPESPVWLVSKRRTEEARRALTWLHKDREGFAQLQLEQLLQERAKKKLEEALSGGGIFAEFLKPTGYKPLLVISGVFLFQQFSGIYIVLFYTVTFFKSVGITSIDPFAASVLIGVIRLVMSIANMWILKSFTRRALMTASSLGMACCVGISALFTRWIENGTSDQQWVPVVGLLSYMMASMAGLMIIPWIITAELFPLKIRSLAHSIAYSIANAVMFVAVQNYVNMEKALGGSAGIQGFFSVVSVGAALYVWVFLPETHEKKLSEIEEYFKHHTVYLRQKKTNKMAHDRTNNNEQSFKFRSKVEELQLIK